MSSDILSPRRSNSRDSTTSPSNSSSIITVMETEFPPLSVAGRGSYSSSSSSSANHSTTRHRSVESNSTTHSGHQDSTESSSSLKSPSSELNGSGTRRYHLPAKLPDIQSNSSQCHLVDSAMINIEPVESPGIIPTPPPPPSSFKLSLSCEHHHYAHQSHHEKKKKPSKNKFQFPDISLPHSEGTCSPEEKRTAAEAIARVSVKSASSPICSPTASSAPKVDTRAANYSSRSECATSSLPVCSLASACAGGLKSKKVIFQTDLDFVAKSLVELENLLSANLASVLPAVYSKYT